VCLGLGADLVTARTVEGRFPNISQVIPKKRPLFTFRVDPKTLAETLLAIADLLPEEARGVQCFYYGDDLPLGFCARNIDNGTMIDALVVPLVIPKESDGKPNEQNAEAKKPDNAEGEDAKQEPETKKRGKKPAPDATEPKPDDTNAVPEQPEAKTQESQAAEQTVENTVANGQDAQVAKKPKRKAKV
jgi:hypothetical protein